MRVKFWLIVAALLSGLSWPAQAGNPVRIGHTTLVPRHSGPDDAGLYNAFIDPTNGYAYFLGNYLFKLDITGSLPVQVGPALNTGSSSHAAIDTAAGYAYISRPPLLNRYSLGTGTNAITSAGSLSLAAGAPSTIFLDDADPDPAKHYGYVVCTLPGSPARVAKIALGTFTEVCFLPLGVGETNAAIGSMADAAKGYGYFGTRAPFSTMSEFVKIKMTPGTNLPMRIGTVSLGVTNESFDGNTIDTLHGYAYYGTYGSTNLPSRVYKVKLGDGDTAPSVVGSIDLHQGRAQLSLPVIDPVNGFVYFANDNTYPGGVHQFSLNGTNLPVEISYLQFQSGPSNNPPDASTADNVTTNSDGILPYGEVFFRSAVFDPVRGYAYFGQDSRPNQVVKVKLAQIDPFTLTGGSTLTNGSFQFGFSNIAGGMFSALAATNPSSPLTNWTLLGPVTEISPGQFQFTDPQATINPRRFYRVSTP